MNLKRLFSIFLAVSVMLSVQAGVYLVDASATSMGAQLTYNNQRFVVGSTAFSSLDALQASSPEAYSTVYVAPGTYSGGTLTTPGLKVLGANPYCSWSQSRSSESTVTGIIYVNASDIEINGFYFTGGGRVVAQAATNAAPQSGIKVNYNYFNGSTVARGDGTCLINIGTRYGDANAAATVSQCHYALCEVKHNKIVGGTGHYANSIGLFGVYGTTTVEDNYLYDGGMGVHICNAQGTVNVNNNKFYYVGVTNSANADGKGVGSFTIYYDRSAYAGTNVLNITNNEFDHCYGQTSYMALLRVYPGSSTNGNLVDPNNLSVNINYNTFTNKTSLSTNSTQLNENFILYSDQSTTKNVKFNIADNHYDNRFYKFSYLNIQDGLGQRQIYSNSVDRFTIAGKYSTMGTSSYYTSSGSAVDISYHLNQTKTSDTTVIQSMDIDPLTGDIYILQLMGSSNTSSFCSANGLSSSECDPLFLTRIPCTTKGTTGTGGGKYTYSTSLQKMSIAKTGHGVKLSVYRDKDGQLWMVTGAKGSDNGTSNDLSGRAICRFKFVSGQKVIADGRSNSAVSLTYWDHPKGYNNVYADIDTQNRYICFSSSGGGVRRYCVYDLDDFFNGKITYFKEAAVAKGASFTSGSGMSGDTGFEWKAYQSFSINGDYVYLFEGEGASGAGTTKPIIISTVNWRTGKLLQRKQINYARINNLTWGEPEAVTIRPDVFGNATMYLGISGNSTYAYVYKFHIDRFVNSSGTVIGDDTSADAKHFNTSEYPGVSMTTSVSSLAFSAASTSETPSQSFTLNRASEYMYGKWTACVTGADGGVFDVSVSDHNPYTDAITITATFRPDGVKENYSAHIRLSSPNASDIYVPITATYTGATSSGPQIYYDATPISIKAAVGGFNSAVTHISGANLEGNVNLEVTGENAGLFTLSHSTLAYDNPATDVTITFTPTAIGTYSATLRLYSTNAVERYITLTGDAYGPEIAYDATPISMSARLGETSTIVKRISGTNLQGNINLELIGENASLFSLSHSSLPYDNPATDVTVSFMPTTTGTFSATLRMSSTNAVAQTIAITGIGVDSNTPEIYYESTPINLSAVVGQSASTTTHISGTKLQGNVNLEVMGEYAGMFTLSHTTLPYDNPATDVTVTFNPSVKGTFSATLRLYSTNAVEQYITLTGTASNLTPSVSDNISELGEVWNFSTLNGNLASAAPWFSTNTDNGSVQTRDMAFCNGKLYVLTSNANANNSNYIQIINAYDGSSIGTLSLNGVTEGQLYAASIKAMGGKVIMSNGAPSGTPLKVYCWDNDASEPYVILNDATHGSVQVGEIMSVWGDLNDGKLMFSDGNKMLIYTVSKGVVNATPTEIKFTKSGAAYQVGSHKGAVDITLNDDGSYWVIGKDQSPIHFNSNGEYIEQVATSAVNGYAVAGRFIDFGTQKYMAAATYLNKSATTLAEGALSFANITDGISNITPLVYPTDGLGATRNTQFMQSVCYEPTTTGLNIWVLSALQGIAHYAYLAPTVVPDPEPEEPTEPIVDDIITELFEVWNYSEIGANLSEASWFSKSAPQSRDMAFCNGKLYIVNSNAAYNSSQSVKIVNAYTGANIGTLSLNGVTKGQLYAASIKAMGGKVIMSNGAPSGTPLKVYCWDNDASEPYVILNDATHGSVQVGEIMSVWGDLNDGKLMFSDGNKMLIYTVSKGVVNATPTEIKFTKSGAAYQVGSHKGAVDITLNDDGSYWVIGKDQSPIHFNSNGEYIEQVATSAVNGYAVAGRFIDFGTQKYMAAATYLNKSATTLAEGALSFANITDGISNITPLFYPTDGLGKTRNTQFMQSVCYESSAYGLNIWTLSCLQGITYYAYPNPSTSGITAIRGDRKIVSTADMVSYLGGDAKEIRVFNLSGIPVAAVADANTICIADLLRGVYVVRVTDKDGKVTTKKIVR